MFVIYALRDPRDNRVHYVGMTQNVYERFLAHINCGGGNFAKSAWILELRAANRMVLMETLEEVETREQAEKREGYWIRHFQALGHPLANTSKMLRNTCEKRRARITIPLLDEDVDRQDSITSYQPKGDDKLLNGEQVDGLLYWHRKVGTVNAALAKMGITNSRYRRHAAYIVELSKQKRGA